MEQREAQYDYAESDHQRALQDAEKVRIATRAVREQGHLVNVENTVSSDEEACKLAQHVDCVVPVAEPPSRTELLTRQLRILLRLRHFYELPRGRIIFNDCGLSIDLGASIAPRIFVF